MKFASGKLKLVNQGSNSEIYLYGDVQKGLILKVEVKHLANEHHMLAYLNHQNIIKALKYQERISLHGNATNKQESSCNVLVLENACHGSLLSYIQAARPSLPEIRWVFAELCEAVRYLHYLKLENVLVAKNESQIKIKLADFGFADSVKESPNSSACKGTRRGYMAPQIHSILTDSTKSYDTLKADIFALGVILFSLVMGRLPFQFATPDNSHYKLIAEQDYESFWKLHERAVQVAQNEEHSMFEDFKTVFISMVQLDASKRPSIKEVLDCSWLKGHQEIIRANKVSSQISN